MQACGPSGDVQFLKVTANVLEEMHRESVYHFVCEQRTLEPRRESGQAGRPCKLVAVFGYQSILLELGQGGAYFDQPIVRSNVERGVGVLQHAKKVRS